jgi:DNA modification methylase
MNITRWEPESFSLETTSVWSFPDRGDWATHDAKYRGNWSPYIPRNLILRYTAEGELILDQFAGGGTTLIEAKLLGRNIIGMDINPVALDRCLEKTSFDCPNAGKVVLRECDARKLIYAGDESVDFICTHPPYANIIRYSKNIENDMSHLGIAAFLEEMKSVAQECFRVLKSGRLCAILMGDTRRRGHVVPLSFEVMRAFQNAGFQIKEIIIKEQHNCKSTGRWKECSERKNFLLLSHEYLFVFRK